MVDEEMRQQIERRRALLDGRWSDAVNWASQNFDAFQRIGEEISACWHVPPKQAASRLRKIVSASPRNFTTMLVLAWVEIEKRYLERTAIQDEVDEAERSIDPDAGPGKEQGPAPDDA